MEEKAVLKGLPQPGLAPPATCPPPPLYIDPLENLKSHIVNGHMREEGYTVMVAQRMEILYAIAMNRVRN